MTNWSYAEPRISDAVQNLPQGGVLVIQREFPGCQMQFARLDVGGTSTLRAEVCNNDPGEQSQLRDRGWELVDQFGGVWRRDVPWPQDEAAWRRGVGEVTHVLKNVWREPTLAGFSYYSWVEGSQPPSWQFWKEKKDQDLTWDLGLPRGED